MLALRIVLGLTAIAVPVLGATYSISESYQGSDFLNGFHHQAISDPTHGRVYVTCPPSPFRFFPCFLPSYPPIALSLIGDVN